MATISVKTALKLGYTHAYCADCSAHGHKYATPAGEVEIGDGRLATLEIGSYPILCASAYADCELVCARCERARGRDAEISRRARIAFADARASGLDIPAAEAAAADTVSEIVGRRQGRFDFATLRWVSDRPSSA